MTNSLASEEETDRSPYRPTDETMLACVVLDLKGQYFVEMDARGEVIWGHTDVEQLRDAIITRSTSLSGILFYGQVKPRIWHAPWGEIMRTIGNEYRIAVLRGTTYYGHGILLPEEHGARVYAAATDPFAPRASAERSA